MTTLMRLLPDQVGLRRPYRFERLLVTFVALSFGVAVVGLAVHLYRTGRPSWETPRAWYFVWLTVLVVVAGLLTRWPRTATALLSLVALDFGLGVGSALLVMKGLAYGSIFPVNYTVEPEFTWHPLLQAVPLPTPVHRAAEARYFHNSQRLRGPERTSQSLAGKTVIAVFGGSTTYDQGVRDGETWPEQLERLLGETDYAVINHGMGGFSTAEHVIQTAFYERAFGVSPRCAAYYIGWNDMQSAHLTNLDPGYADYHLPMQIDAEEARRIGGRKLQVSPTLTYLARLTVLGFDTARPALWPEGEPIAEPDPTLEEIYRRSIQTISAINRQRGTRTIWIGQLLNRPELNKAETYRWIPRVLDRDLWPLVARLNTIARDQAATLGDVYADVEVDDFDSSDFVDQGHFSAKGSAKFASLLAPYVVDACP